MRRTRHGPLWQRTDRSVGKGIYEAKLLALETLAGALIVVGSTERTVYLRQSPEIVAARIQRNVSGVDRPERNAAEDARAPSS